MVNNLLVKSLIFTIFDISKEIWNNYYNILKISRGGTNE